MQNRAEFPELLLKHNLMHRGVEVGTFLGEFAKQILDRWPGTLYMVDVWRPLPKEEYDDLSNQENHIDAYAKAMEYTKAFVERAHMLRMKSHQAVELFDDYSLDFVYIDANHTYESVLEDITLWYPKIKIDGIVAGHDFLKVSGFDKENYDKGIKNLPIYMWPDNNPSDSRYAGMFGVNPAVEEFCEAHRYKFEVTTEWMGSWWFVKK